MKRLATLALTAAAFAVLAACSSTTSTPVQGTPATSTASATAASSAAADQPVEACALLSPADIAVILGKDPGKGIATVAGVCNYMDAPMQFTVAQARDYPVLTSAVEEQLAKSGRSTLSTPVKGAENAAVSYDLGNGASAVAARTSTWSALVSGTASIEQLTAIDGALIAALNAKS